MKGAVVLASVIVWVVCGAAHAQDDGGFVEPNDSQMQLYEDGSKAFKAGKYEQAVRLFEASLVVGELNITWLNLGRVLFKMNKCVEARKAFAKVRKAPRVREPTPETVLSRLNEYMVELDLVCGESRGPIQCPPGTINNGQECVPDGELVCQAGKVKSEDTKGRCCWPGQTWDGEACVGVPRTCAEGLVTDIPGEACVCPGGRVQLPGESVRCCWPGQSWSAMRKQCVGKASECPEGTVMRGGQCRAYKKNIASLGINTGSFLLTYERLLSRAHSVVIGLGGGRGNNNLPQSLISPGPGQIFEDQLVESNSAALSLGYRWSWRGGLDSPYVSGHVGLALFREQAFELEEEGFEVGFEDALMFVAAVNAGKRWYWSPGFTAITGGGVGFFAVGNETFCSADEIDGDGAAEACDAFNASNSDVGIFVSLELSMGWSF